MAPQPAEDVVIVPYDAIWAGIFRFERRRIREALLPWVQEIEHIGSTSVAGLAAKPIIDILVGLRRLEDARECIPRMEALGYEYVPESKLHRPLEGRQFFRRVDEKGLRSHHVHIVAVTSEFWEREILFRDYLRWHPHVARQYEQLKRDLAVRFRTDRDAYTDGKSAFIRTVQDMAREERDKKKPR
ncbi:MAG: GrpB family protein [Chloroflexi bacterium]|nr:GrpB family protein [Chloroflexota bacterium]